jgi:hypothetical protein
MYDTAGNLTSLTKTTAKRRRNPYDRLNRFAQQDAGHELDGHAGKFHLYAGGQAGDDNGRQRR